MVVPTDLVTDVDEHEEVLALHDAKSAVCLWLIWRDAERVWVQSLFGRPQDYGSAAEAMSVLVPPRPFAQTDISTTSEQASLSAWR
jgi:hypothetical protein